MKEENTVSSAEMKEIERIADGNGLTYRQMMENAGTAAYEVIRQRWPDAERIVIFAGKGNNGGDGFVVARMRLFCPAENTKRIQWTEKGKNDGKGRRRIAARRPELLWCSAKARRSQRMRITTWGSFAADRRRIWQ